MKTVDPTPPRDHDEVSPYLWDKSDPEDPEIAALERTLGVLGYRETEVPMPRAETRPPTVVRRLHPAWYAAGAALAIAAAAAVGWFAGRRSGAEIAHGAAPSASAASSNGAVHVEAPESVPSVARPDSRPSRCVDRDPGGGALHYEVVRGTVSCDGVDAPGLGWLPLETWFETDGSSRVVLEVADLGRVELAPSTRLRILPAARDGRSSTADARQHRLELDRGVINARIDAPPRLFIVETKAASAVDLGCAYTLEVGEDGGGLLRVGKGEVALETPSGRPAVVHRGEVCETRVGLGAGTPFSVTSTPSFRRALAAWDFEGGTLDAVLAAATKEDAAGLLRAIGRVSSTADRARLVASLDALGAGPLPTERADVLHGDAAALERYRSRIAKGPVKPAP